MQLEKMKELHFLAGKDGKDGEMDHEDETAEESRLWKSAELPSWKRASEIHLRAARMKDESGCT